MEDEVNITTTHVPHIAKLERGETFVMNMPQCCTAGLDGVPADDCSHITQPHKKIKVNIGL